LIAYPIIGLIWMCVRWILYVWNISDKLREAIDRHLATSGDQADAIDNSVYRCWIESIKGLDHDAVIKALSRYSDPPMTITEFRKLAVPKVADSRSYLCAWFVYWPLSILKYIFSDLFQFVWNRVYTVCRKFLQGMANRIFQH
jgi:hypothetical protein